ncbi:MFS transporter [Arsenicicoccus bolidensis]|uniref:MFS transporter n=1 Tax=Arsenicicoccus bolidensis TaxID=229480 RepID=UPI00041E9091|nr:MFS transporter [Arsenicicoccus bolidensis]
MSGTAVAGSYRTLLADPVVARTFVLALVGRLGYAVLPLTFLFTVRQSTDSFATAAAAMAVFGSTTLVMPVQARLADRHGQRVVLTCVAAGFVLVLGAAALVARGSGGAPAAAWLAISVLLGLTAPALGPSMRAQWRWFVPEGPARVKAYSLDAVCEETLYLVGPVVAAAVLARGPAWHGLVLVAGLIAVGAAGLVSSPAATVTAAAADLDDPKVLAGPGASPAPSDAPRPSDAPASGGAAAPGRRGSPLGLAGMRRLLALMAGFGCASALMYTGVAARADAAGHPGWAGYVEAAVAAASVIGGLAWGARRHRRAWPAQLAGTLALLGISLCVASAMTSWWLLGVVLVGAGLAVSPSYTVAFVAADVETPPHLRTEASTWVSTITNLGSSGGTALAGVVVGAWGAGAPLAVAGVVALVAAAAAGSLAATASRS